MFILINLLAIMSFPLFLLLYRVLVVVLVMLGKMEDKDLL